MTKRTTIVLNGAALRAARVRRNWDQQDLALGAVRSEKTVRRAEKGLPIDVQTARDLAGALAVSLESLRRPSAVLSAGYEWERNKVRDLGCRELVTALRRGDAATLVTMVGRWDVAIDQHGHEGGVEPLPNQAAFRTLWETRTGDARGLRVVLGREPATHEEVARIDALRAMGAQITVSAAHGATRVLVRGRHALLAIGDLSVAGTLDPDQLVQFGLHFEFATDDDPVLTRLNDLVTQTFEQRPDDRAAAGDLVADSVTEAIVRAITPLMDAMSERFDRLDSAAVLQLTEDSVAMVNQEAEGRLIERARAHAQLPHQRLVAALWRELRRLGPVRALRILSAAVPEGE